jgi:hypothetical protein
MLDYSEYDFESTAKAVYMMNESARERYDSWQKLREDMLSFASQYSYNEGCTSFATGGYCLSFARGDGKVYVTPSVQSYTALRYAEQVANRLDTIRSLTD